MRMKLRWMWNNNVSFLENFYIWLCSWSADRSKLFIGKRIPPARDCHCSLTQYTSPRYFAVKYSRYRGWDGGGSPLHGYSLLAQMLFRNILRWMRVDWITVTFFLHFSALPRRFASRISNNIRTSFWMALTRVSDCCFLN